MNNHETIVDKDLENEIYNSFQNVISNSNDLEKIITKVVSESIRKHYNNINTIEIEDSIVASIFIKTSISALDYIISEQTRPKVIKSIGYVVSEIMIVNNAKYASILSGALYQMIHFGSWSKSTLSSGINHILEGIYYSMSKKVNNDSFSKLIEESYNAVRDFFNNTIQEQCEFILTEFNENLAKENTKWVNEKFID